MPAPIKSTSVLSEIARGAGAAFLVHDGRLYLAGPVEREFPGESPVTRLIRGIWALEPAQALQLLRNRIHTNRPLTPVCEGMIKVAAKRSSVLSAESFHERVEALDEDLVLVSGPLPGTSVTRELGSTDPVNLLLQLKSRSRSPKPVGAVLLSPEGQPLIGAWSANEVDRTAHAELNLVRAWFESSPDLPPAGSVLQVSLRPCAMCAAQILALSGEPGRLRIFFHEEDPGPLSKNSCLVPGSDLWKRAGEPAWEALAYLPSL